ncbi:sulfotransferase [Maritimibacter sp. UBA3975]|uniref:sulfotransferase n=1 Tax=Maritimibacter sp. UBA3975 TaxID=1946833 RepID=UPI000C0BB77E|nr:sulfotransferase [Maritimibacter sp. UBA3975]MAM60764.1 sulfotransferase family protein [Maritimibacter sp.]|tara:strand:+ start:25512 stop:26252 length:741 start_codon:yes stop_codon:yes gene_type:complete
MIGRLGDRFRAMIGRPAPDLLTKFRRRFPRLEGTVFILTYGRSGSTLLQALLNSAPGVHIAGESFDAFGALVTASERATRAHMTWGQDPRGPDHPWHGADMIDEWALEAALGLAFAAHVIRPPHDVRWLGFKEIRLQPWEDRFDTYIDTLRRSFPNAMILFNSRAAADVAASKWWAEHPPGDVARMVARLDARFADYTASHPDHAVHLHHDTTVTDPSSLRPVFEAMNLPFDVAALRAVLSNRLDH